jgi:hypothetical protein
MRDTTYFDDDSKVVYSRVAIPRLFDVVYNVKKQHVIYCLGKFCVSV